MSTDRTPTELALALDRSAPRPLAAQLADALRGAAGSGRLRVGDRVPATRALAAELGVSRTVTAAAYDQLLAEGWLAGRRGAGTFVLAAPPSPAPVEGRVGGAAGGPVGEVATGAPGGPVLHELRPGSPCLDVLDRAAWRRAWRRAGDVEPDGRPQHAGVPAFRAVVAELLVRHRGLPAAPDAVLATAGTTAGLAEVLGVLAARSGRPPRVAVEEPGYRRAVGAVRAAGGEVVTVGVDAGGLDVDALPSGVDAVYVTPAHQYPLGARLALARRAALVARARAESFVVVEDDYDGELRYDAAPLPLLAGLAPDVVVHLGTASKVLTPTLGTGWALAPPDLHTELLAARRATGIRPAPAGQLVLAALGADGALGRHLTRLRRELAGRRRAVVAAVAAAGHGVTGDRAGAHLVVELPDAATAVAAVSACRARGVAVDGLAAHHAGPAVRHGVLVGWAAPTRAALPDALERLRDALVGVGAGPDA